MKVQLRDVVLFICTYIQVTYSRPIQLNSFYQFWKTVDKQSIPQTKALQELLSSTIESLCETDEINESIPENQSCYEYIQKLSSKLSLPVTQEITAKNPNKFMKELIKNTVRSLNVYDELVQVIADEYSKSGENCQDGICNLLNSLSSNLNKLIESIASKTKQYFHISNLKKRNKMGFSIKDKSEVEKVAILYGLSNQLKEAESALEFTVKSTWDVHIRQMTKFQDKRKRRKRLSQKVDLGI